jgi:antirestriction protein ArdC
MSRRSRADHGYASYLNSWIKVLERDPMAIFTAAKAAERVSDYDRACEPSR